MWLGRVSNPGPLTYESGGTSGGKLKLHRPSVSPSVRYKSCLSDSSKTTEANLMKLHRKIKHNEKVCRARFRFLRPRSRSQSGQRSNRVSAITQKTTKANLTKLHRKIDYNEKVCRAQWLGSYSQGQGHGHVRGQIVPKILLLINY